MKRIKMIMIALMMTIVTSASAMTYSQAKDQALFLADKMAYELNLTDEQYETAYEINLNTNKVNRNVNNSRNFGTRQTTTTTRNTTTTTGRFCNR